MERIGEFHCHRSNAKSSSGMKILLDNNLPKRTTTMAGKDRSEQCSVREQDQYMPIANVIRIMRRILPSHAKISDDAKETIQECVSEYISFITGEANERCQREQRKTVTAEDVLWAMGKLGFDDYVDPLTVYLNRYRETENDRTRVEPILRRGAGEYGPPVGILGGYEPGFQVGYFDAMGGYYGGSGGPSSSAAAAGSGNSLPGFDPFSQFK